MGLFFRGKIMEYEGDYLSEKELADYILTSRMEEEITALGNKKVWEVIERFDNYKTRLAYRKFFLKAGGVIPKSEV